MFAFRPYKKPIPFTDVKPGDIIGFCGHNWSSNAISLGCIGSPFWSLSHVGIVGELNGELVLFESTTDDPEPCLIQGKCFNGTQAHSLAKRLELYPGKIWHYSLYRELYAFERERLNEFLRSTVGRPYDYHGAPYAGGFLFSIVTGYWQEESLNTLFCSEWVAAALAVIGLFATTNASRWNPSKLVRMARLLGIIHKPRRHK
jgi:hypothetical protein